MVQAPIALFVYNRPEHTKETLSALKRNYLADSSDLIIFSDGPKSEEHAESVNEVRRYIREVSGFKTVSIVERTENLGLAQSIIKGVTSVVHEYGRIIVLEDDLVTSPYFLQFMNDGLRHYEKNKDVASIHGYVYPIEHLPETFFMRGADCWGWATWSDRWEMFQPDGTLLLAELKRRNLTDHFDFNGGYPFTQMLADQVAKKNNSWAIRWHASAFLANKLTLYPAKSYVLNIGNDGSGTHCGVTEAFTSELATLPVSAMSDSIIENNQAFTLFEKYFKAQQGGIITRLRRRLFAIVKNLV